MSDELELRDPLLAKLNDPQARAAAQIDGPVLVFAAAGSGKTKTLTTRVAYMIRSRGIKARNILAVTFTNKSARELKERLVAILGEEAVAGISVGTFHAQCVRILRSYASEIDRTKDFLIYDTDAQETVVKQVIKELGLNKETYTVELVGQRIQKAKQEAEDIDALEVAAWDKPEELMFVRVYRRYEAWMKSCNALDFEDLILKTMLLAESDSEVGEALRSRFTHVLVDEAQDTNTTQFRLVKALATSRNLFMVGDDFQAIYSWRGANVGNIKSFKTEYPDILTVKLEENYRSTKHIISCANAIIEKGEGMEPKVLWTANEQGARVTVIEAPDEEQEAKFVARRISGFLRKNESPSGMAVLYRTNAQSRVIEQECMAREIPYRVVGGFRFFDRKEVKDVLAYARLVTNRRSDVDFLRVINMPVRGIGERTIERLQQIAGSRGMSLYDALPSAAIAPELPRAQRQQLDSFHRMIAMLGDGANEARPSELIEKIVQTTGYKRMWESEAQHLAAADKRAKAEEAAERADNVAEVIKAVESYERNASARGERATLRGYLDVIALVHEEEKDETVEKVSLMSVHAAKGTEHARVFLIGVDKMPSARAATKAEFEEERRVMYVAVTRAKLTLFISYPMQRWARGQLKDCSPGEYLDDLPEASVVRLTMGEYERLEHEAKARMDGEVVLT